MQTMKFSMKRLRAPALIGGTIAGVAFAALFSAVTANAESTPQAEFKSYTALTAKIPEYYFEGNLEPNFDRSSELPIAETKSATYWYISTFQGVHCLVAQTKAVDQVSAGCVPDELLKNRPLSLQMFQHEGAAFDVAAFLLPQGFTSNEAESNAEFTTPNFIEVDALAVPGAFDQEYSVIGKNGSMRLEIFDVEAPK